MHLVVGASGRLGSRVARRLLERGEAVRAVSRSPRKLHALAAAGAEPIRGDLREDGWLGPALDGVTSVILAAHGFFPPSLRNHPYRTDDAGNRRIIDAAARSGDPHVLFVSAAMEEAGRPLFAEIKRRVERHLERSGLDFAVVRPTVFIETHAVTLMAEPLRETGRVRLFGGGRTRLNWISTEDVADYIVDLLLRPRDGRRIHRIGGPDRLTRLEALEVVEQVLGRRAKRSHVPLRVLRGVRRVVGSVHPGVRVLLQMAEAEETRPDYGGWNPPELDWTGSRTVQEVVRKWAAEKAA